MIQCDHINCRYKRGRRCLKDEAGEVVVLNARGQCESREDPDGSPTVISGPCSHYGCHQIALEECFTCGKKVCANHVFWHPKAPVLAESDRTGSQVDGKIKGYTPLCAICWMKHSAPPEEANDDYSEAY